ncbi:MAG TPA: endonuclease/exonuclease/phosphatase family protein [Pseudobdellovibrionaceae bacterium]|jgi:endonuclease/exonuclease/phosphatase family metal-dependent hydrolase
MKYSPICFFTLFAASFFIFTLGCTTSGPKTTMETKEIREKTPRPDEVSVMNFNVENLFDTIHDENRDDYAYLPLLQKQTPEHKAVCAKINQIHYRKECLTLDWNEDVVNAKLKNLAQVILGVDGQGPDILVMEEVENERILTRLNKEFLTKAGYQTQVLIEGSDERGIDVALLSRFPIVGTPELHKIPYVAKNDSDKIGMGKSRGILEVKLKLPNQETLTLLGAHFPSQANPRYWREQAVEFLAKMIQESANNMVIASGDLNISHNEEIEARFFHDSFSEVALVSHLVGCKKCEGSHNYRKEWSFLDALLFSKNMGESGTASYKLEPETITIVHSDPIHLWGSYPKRFKPETKEGVSDHFPLYARIRLRAKMAVPVADVPTKFSSCRFFGQKQSAP